MQTYVRLTRYTLEKEIIAQFPNSFGLTIPANLLMYYCKSLAEFISKNPKPFFIDPMTYIFVYPTNMLKTENFELQVDREGNYKLKKSYEKLVRACDRGLIELFQSRNSLLLLYFDDPSNVEKFVKNNIGYQKNLLRNSLDKVSKYESMLGDDISRNLNLEPEFITAPYFYFRNTSDQWYNVSLRLSQLTKELSPDDRVYSVICADKQSLNSTLVDTIVSDFDEVDGFLLFASDFNESIEPASSLRRLRSFVNRLHEESSKPILNLYGSFYSVLLKYDGLEGVSSGLCILDHRDATAEFIGARAPIRFYLPSVRNKISEQDYKTYLERFNPVDECNCNLCQVLAERKNTLSSREYVSYVGDLFSGSRGQLMTDTMEHFLYNRLQESELVNTSPFSEVRTILETNRRTSRRYARLLNTGNFVDAILRT